MQSETLAEEFSRLVREYKQDDGPGGIEAWNLIADFAVDNADAIEAALSAAEPRGYLIHDKDNPDGRYFKQKPSISDDDMSEYEIWIEPLYAAPPPPPAPSVTVKALEWEKVALDSGNWNWLEVEKSETPFGTYSLQKHTKGDLRIISGTGKIGFFQPDQRSEAKAAAQADYEARIRSALSAQVQDVADSPAIKAIAAERRRQIEKEGWSPDHDDAHCDGSIALAAACYAMFAAVSDNARRSTQLPGSLTNDGQAVEGWAAFLSIWPWERHFWKPTTRVRDLEKAGALIAAELDRVIRAAAPAKQGGGHVTSQ